MLLSSLLITFFFVVYALVHSLLAGLGVKRWFRQTVGPESDRWYRLAYNIFSVVTLLPLFLMLVLLPDRMFYVVPSPWRWLMVAGQGVAVVGLAVTLWQTGALHFLGLAQLINPRPRESGSLTTSGFYGWVRHPLYFFSLLFIWLTPALTINLLTTFILFTLYFYIGSIYEEKRLLAEFGAAYRRYQQHVPRLIPGVHLGSRLKPGDERLG